jgi:hypothetical protein
MKPPKLLPTWPPFLTLYTNTFRRPQALARNMASICRQTAVDDVEQIIVPDHVGYGIAGALYGRIPWYANAARGRYVAMLTDDDQLAAHDVVAKLRDAVKKERMPPPVLVVRVEKGGVTFPKCDATKAPVEGDVDLGSYVLRHDIWQRHAGDYGLRYQGDYDHAVVLFGKYPVVPVDLLFAVGPAGGGRPEVDW